MNYYIKSILKLISSSTQRNFARRLRRHFLSVVKPRRKISLDDMKSIIVDDLGIHKGDKIIVSSSFGNLNANFSPRELAELLMEIVGEEGVIMMPYYPPISSVEWANKHEVFDMRTTKSGMGILTNVFSKMQGVVMSKHPTKAVCVWGKGAEEIAADHDKATTPFYWDSPYGKFFKLHTKSLGLGLKNIPIFHLAEDIYSDDKTFYYQKQKFKLELIDLEGNKSIIETYVHDDDILNHCQPGGDYTRELNCKSYKRIMLGYRYVYVIDNDDYFETALKKRFEKGDFRYLR